jgi:hypothetical protein
VETYGQHGTEGLMSDLSKRLLPVLQHLKVSGLRQAGDPPPLSPECFRPALSAVAGRLTKLDLSDLALDTPDKAEALGAALRLCRTLEAAHLWLPDWDQGVLEGLVRGVGVGPGGYPARLRRLELDLQIRPTVLAPGYLGEVLAPMVHWQGLVSLLIGLNKTATEPQLPGFFRRPPLPPLDEVLLPVIACLPPTARALHLSSCQYPTSELSLFRLATSIREAGYHQGHLRYLALHLTGISTFEVAAIPGPIAPALRHLLRPLDFSFERSTPRMMYGRQGGW